jgi:hypothetical protein
VTAVDSRDRVGVEVGEVIAIVSAVIAMRLGVDGITCPAAVGNVTASVPAATRLRGGRPHELLVVRK